MRLSRRRITVGLVSTAVVATMTSVTTFALAGTSAPATAKPVRLIVGYRNGGDPAVAVQTMKAFGARAVAQADVGQQALSALGAQSVQVPAAQSAGMIASLRSDPNVAYVEVDHVRHVADVTPNDPLYTAGSQSELARVNLPAAWQTTTGSAAVKIAVVDTGVTGTGDLAGAVTTGYDFVNNDSSPSDDFIYSYTDPVTHLVVVDHGHGTKVGSLIAARGNDGAGMAGVCWQCTILPVKVLDQDGNGYDSTVAKGIVYATNAGANVINLSMGGEEPSSTLADAVAYANYKGVLVVAAAGNEGGTKRSYPAALTDVLAVGGTERDSDARIGFSNYNSASDKWVDVAVPAVTTAMNSTGDYATAAQGTSFSTPIVSGIAGLVKTVHPTYTGWSLQHTLTRSAVPIGSWVTYGKVDAAGALTVGTDTTPPTMTGVTPGQWAKVHGVITVKPVGVKDDWSSPEHVDLYVDGKWKTYDRTVPFALTYDTKGRNGSVHLQVRLFDKAGNVKVLDRWITADNTAPSVKITKAPKNKSKIKGTVKISAAATDKYGVSRLQLLINGKVVKTASGGKYTFSFKAASYPKNITVQVRAYDIAGNLKVTSKLYYHR